MEETPERSSWVIGEAYIPHPLPYSIANRFLEFDGSTVL
jgi:hypothetical protein